MDELSDLEISTLFNSFDKNRNGSIDYNEFISALTVRKLILTSFYREGWMITGLTLLNVFLLFWTRKEQELYLFSNLKLNTLLKDTLKSFLETKVKSKCWWSLWKLSTSIIIFSTKEEIRKSAWMNSWATTSTSLLSLNQITSSMLW